RSSERRIPAAEPVGSVIQRIAAAVVQWMRNPWRIGPKLALGTVQLSPMFGCSRTRADSRSRLRRQRTESFLDARQQEVRQHPDSRRHHKQMAKDRWDH